MSKLFGRQWILICIPVSLLVSLNLISCKQKQGPVSDFEDIPVTSPVVADTSVTLEYIAGIQSFQNVEIRSRVKGFLDKIYVDEGKNVKRGQVLFSISNQEYSQELLKAQASMKSAVTDVKTAEAELKNVKILVSQNVVSGTEQEMAQSKYDAALAHLEEAKANVSGAELNLSYTTIKAPFDGIINRLPNKTGSLINDGTLLTTISNNNEVYAYFNLSEKEYLDMKEMGPDESKVVNLVLANNKPYKYTGTIETVDGEIDRTTGNIAYRAKFNNPEQILKHGASGKIRISRKIEKALLVPQKSTFEVQGNIYVFVVKKDNSVEMRQIVLSNTLPQLYIVGSGLSSQEQIVYEGTQKLKEGDKIIPRTVSFLKK
jgi:RND family efflux transporter MFP subunit